MTTASTPQMMVPGQDRWIGGVATGIFARTGLDVILVRGLFVVLPVFGGIGLLVYGLAWACCPNRTDAFTRNLQPAAAGHPA